MKRIVLYSVATLIILGLSGFLFLEPIINSSPVKSRMVTLIEKQIGTRIDPDQLTFLVTPQPGIQVGRLALPLTRDIRLSVETVHLDLDLRALLKKKIWVSRISLKNLRIETLSDKNRTGLTFHDPMDFRFPEQQIEQMFALLPDSENQLQIVLENSATPQFSSLTGHLWISKTDQTLQFDTQIKDLHVTRDWLARFFSAPDFRMDQLTSGQARLHVHLNPDTGITGNLRLDRFEITSSRLSRSPVRGSGVHMAFSYLPDQVGFHLDPVLLEYPFAQVSMSFSNILSTRKTALTFQGDQIDISQARDVSLALAPDNAVVNHLFNILRQGTASDVTVGFHATTWDTLFDPRKMTLEGTAENALVKIPGIPLMAEDVSGTASVSDGGLTIQARNGIIESSKMTRGRLAIDLLHPSHVPFTGEFDLNVNLAEVPATLIRLLPDTMLAKEMARVTDLKGRADVQLILAVTPDQPDLSVSVSTKPFSCTGSYDRIPFPVTVSQGVFQYENNQVRVTDVSGTIGKTRVNGGSARVSIKKKPALDLFVNDLDIDIQEIWPELYSLEPFKTRVAPIQQVSGRLMITQLQYKGPMFDLTKGVFDFSGTGRDIRIGFSPQNPEIRHLSAGFDMAGNRVTINDLAATITDLDWLSDWIPATYTAGLALPFQVAAGGFQMQKDRIFLSGHAVMEPNMQLSIQLSGTGLDDLKPDRIQLEHKPLTDATLLFDRHLPPPAAVQFKGRLDTRTLENFLDKASPIYQRLMVLTKGQPVEIMTDTDNGLQVHARLIHLDPLTSIMMENTGSGVLLPFPGNHVALSADRVEYRTFRFSDLKAGITRGDHQIDIRLDTADFCGVDISGRMTLNPASPDRPAETTLLIHAANRENVGELLSCFYPGIHLMEGGYSLDAALSATGPVNTLPAALTGDITFVSENGQIHKMTLLSRLLSVLNVLKLPDIRQEGFRYHRIEVNAHMKNGVIHLEKAVIDAENMALFFTGEIHPFENRLDLTCLVAPFKTIDTIVQFIPVVNTILDGRLVSFPARATGAIDDPEITPLHPSAVGEGLVNMFTNLLKSPARLLEKIP